jgi:hypothetical protein
MMAEPDPARTLALASQFRAPKPDNKALQELQTRHLLTEMEQTGQTKRSTATNLSNYDRTLAGLGMTRETAGAALPQLLKDLQFERVAPAAAKAQRGGLHFQLPTDQPTTIGQLPGVPLVKGLMAGEAAAKMQGKVVSKEGAGETRTGVEYNPKTGELETVVRKTESSRQGTTKGAGTTKNAQAIQASVAAKLKAMGRAFKSIEVVREEADGVVVRIDGKERMIPYDD